MNQDVEMAWEVFDEDQLYNFLRHFRRDDETVVIRKLKNSDDIVWVVNVPGEDCDTPVRDDQIVRVAALFVVDCPKSSDFMITPTVIISKPNNRYDVFWALEDDSEIKLEEFATLQLDLAKTYGGNRRATNLACEVQLPNELFKATPLVERDISALN